MAMNKELKTLVANYGYQAYYLQSPGSLIISIILTFWLSYNECIKKSGENVELIKSKITPYALFDFEWLRTIYCEEF